MGVKVQATGHATLVAMLAYSILGAPPDEARAQEEPANDEPTRAAEDQATRDQGVRGDNDGGTSAALPELVVERYELANGLRIVLNADATSPTVAVAMHYNVGSSRETRGRSGYAHLLEHVVFRRNDEVQSRGGQAMAQVDEDLTTFVVTLPKHELALGLWTQARRLQWTAIDDGQLERHVATVQQERQRRLNRPYARAARRLNELAYGDYWAYAHATEGEGRDLRNADVDALHDFFNRFYTPNNAVLTIAGDFNAAEARSLIESYLGSVAAGDRHEGIGEPPPPQTAERRETVADPYARRSAFYLGYHIPPSTDDDHADLELLAMVLGDGRASRLHRALVDTGICRSVHAGTDDRRGSDLLTLSGVMAPGRRPVEARGKIDWELRSIAERGVTPRELERIRTRVAAYTAFRLESNAERAVALGKAELLFGDATRVLQRVQNALSITSGDLQAAARRYFTATNRSLLYVVPTRESNP